jgi:fructose-bisphosphate aldolase class I
VDLNQSMMFRMKVGLGFIAALDQSGQSTPNALSLYGIDASEWEADSKMYDLIHKMRSRIAQSKDFNGDRVIGAILFEDTMNRTIDGVPTSRFLWERKGIVPFLKIDKGLEPANKDVQLLKPIPDLTDLLRRAVAHGIFGTKQRSVVHGANQDGIRLVVEQQLDLARKVLGHGLVPIMEPEIDIHIPDKRQAEAILLEELLSGLNRLPDDGCQVMLKVSLPSESNLYEPVTAHPKVLRVVALSGGYSRDQANEKLALNSGIIASFSRALTEGLTSQQTEAEFDRQLGASIGCIYDASTSG